MFTLLGPPCHLVNASDIEELERIVLEMPISLVFCEFPSNPLLISPDLKRLRALADNHNFLVMLDVTLANFINLRGLDVADIVVTSLTKIFSGQSDVMGGCVVLPKRSKYHFLLKARQHSTYEDTLYCRDTLILLRNSQDLKQRALTINSNALKLAHLLSKSSFIQKVNYPKFITPDLYQAFMARDGGYGGVMSIQFKLPSEAINFYNTIALPKGMSIGANFTLVAPFAVLAYPDDTEFAMHHGINPFLVRISVGIEPYAMLESSITAALGTIPHMP
ncbi:Cystathionine gamma-synthase [Entomophthora muscae]|uniref:Cystathionine gamma-synthase n=1 Tax=Entomophthora muscae TaxID=34485 RepID=A0ACC2TP94_9FUNG|nr:Cystathionine gamma-synthase [Entomophthora muscae]